MIKPMNLIAAVLLTVAPVSAFAAGTYTIPSVPLMSDNAGPMLGGAGTFGSSGGGIYGSPGLGEGQMAIGGLSSTLGATGAATGGLVEPVVASRAPPVALQGYPAVWREGMAGSPWSHF